MSIMDQETQRITDYSDGSIGTVVYTENVFHDIAAVAAKEVDGVVSAQIKNIKLNQEDAFTIGLNPMRFTMIHSDLLRPRSFEECLRFIESISHLDHSLSVAALLSLSWASSSLSGYLFFFASMMIP